MTEPGSGGWPVTVLDAVDSTNDVAKQRAREHDVAGRLPDPQWIRADRQTAGRGRQGRQWASPSGNLYATALFPLPGGYRDAAKVPFLAALAVAETVEAAAPGACPRLKWPNDVRIDQRKVSGILVESGTSEAGLWVAAGIGINVSHVPDGAGQEATSIASLRGDSLVGVEAVMDLLNRAFSARIVGLENGFAAIRQAWLDRAEGLGETVRVRSGAGDTYLEGIFEDMAADGSLVLRLPDGTARPIRAGDVDLVRRV